MPTARPSSAALLAVLLAAPQATLAGEQVEPLMDNSFLIEEAYNQEPGVVQQILTFARDRASGAWLSTLTQEWPAGGQAHQLSYTLAFEHWNAEGGSGQGLSDLLLNYRYQAVSDERVAVAPRVSLVVPTGGPSGGSGYRGLGLQTNLAVSTVLAPTLVTHANLGLTWVPNGAGGASFVAANLGQSFVWLARPRFNVLLETLWVSTDRVAGGLTTRGQTLVVSPGVRWGLDLPPDTQLVLGLAVPLGLGPSAGDQAVLGYLSVELPFWHPAPAPPAP